MMTSWVVKQWVAQVQICHAFSHSSTAESHITNAQKMVTKVGVPLWLMNLENLLTLLNMEFVSKVVILRLVRKISSHSFLVLEFWWLPWFPANSCCAYTFAIECIFNCGTSWNINQTFLPIQQNCLYIILFPI